MSNYLSHLNNMQTQSQSQQKTDTSKLKNYIIFVDDHSGSMESVAAAALQDSNSTRRTIADLSMQERQNTVVSAFGVGLGGGSEVKRKYILSNPNVMQEETSWPCPGGTPLYDGIWQAIETHKNLPDANDEDTSFLMYITSDGQEMHSKRNRPVDLQAEINRLQLTGRWTFVARMPVGCTSYATRIGVPADNVLEWETTIEGMKKATQANFHATKSYYESRSLGSKSTSVFYADAKQVNTKVLKDVSNELSLYVVPEHQDGIEIRDFILTKRQVYLKGAAFYQLTKTEARVQHDKLVLIRDRNNGKVYAGDEARDMIGLPRSQNARLHPGDHKNYDIFIQSSSVNRKLIKATGVLYWGKVGKPFTAADLAYLQPKAKPDVVQLPAVPVSTKPTPSPLKVNAAPLKLNQTIYQGKLVNVYSTRARARAAKTGTPRKGHVELAGAIYGWYTEV